MELKVCFFFTINIYIFNFPISFLQVVEIWEGSFKLPNPPTAESLAKVERNFINDACLRVKYGPSSLSLYTKWRVCILERILAVKLFW